MRDSVNIASEKPVAIKEVVGKIARKIDNSDLIQLGAIPPSANDPPLLVADVSRLSNEVTWSPQYNLDRGLELVINWWKNQIN